MRSRYTIREPGVPYFITCTVVKWIPLFTRKPYFDILIDTLQFCRQHKGLKIYAYVILDNHLHLVVAGDKLTDILRDFKSYTAKLLIARLEQDQKTWVLNQFRYYKQPTKTRSDYQVWQEGFHPPADRLGRDAASEDRLPALQSGAGRGGGAAGRMGLL
jgi:putative transposase